MSAPATEQKEAPDEFIHDWTPARHPLGKYNGANFGKQGVVADTIATHMPQAIKVRVVPFCGLGSDLLRFPPVKFEHAGDKDGRVIEFLETLVEYGEEIKALIDGTAYADSTIRDSKKHPLAREIARAMQELINVDCPRDKVHIYAEAAVRGAKGEARYRIMKAWRFYLANMGGREDTLRKDNTPSVRTVLHNKEGGHNPARTFHATRRINEAQERFRYTQFHSGRGYHELLNEEAFRTKDVLWYLDPPWIWREGETTFRTKNMYKHEMNTWPEHMRFLKFVLENMGDAKVMILGVNSRLYKCMLETRDWQRVGINDLAQHGKGEKYSFSIFKNPACVEACEAAKRPKLKTLPPNERPLFEEYFA